MSVERGKLRYPLTDLCKSTRTGTTIHFKPDPEIFGEHTFDYQYIHDRFQELSGLFPGVKLNLADERTGKEAEFHCPNGLADYVRFLNRDRDPLFPDVFQHQQEWDGAHIGVALQSTTGFEPIVRSFVNAGQCHEGTHIKGFRTGLKRGLHRYAVSHGLILETAPTIEHYMEGITAAISVWLEDPYYEGPTRFKLVNVEMAQAVAEVVQSGIEAWSEQCPECIQQMIDKAAMSAEMDAT